MRDYDSRLAPCGFESNEACGLQMSRTTIMHIHGVSTHMAVSECLRQKIPSVQRGVHGIDTPKGMWW